MGTIAQTATLTATDLDRVVADAAASYQRLPKALRDAHPEALRRALVIAGGRDYARRLTVEEDGSVIVWNTPQW